MWIDALKVMAFCGVMCMVVPLAQAQVQPTLDELLNLTPPRSTEDGRATPPPATSDDHPLEQLLNDEQAGDLLSQVVDDFQKVSTRLVEDHDPGLNTQRLQESIADKLDQLIAQARKQAQSQSGGSGGGSSQADAQQTGNQQNQTSSSSSQPGSQAAGPENSGAFSPGSQGNVDPGRGPMQEHRSEWGNLPPRLRDELIQGMEERFSPVYRQMTERYFQRLAEDRP